MSAQLSLLPNDPQPVKGADRFAECRWRVAQDCGGHHAPGAVVAGYPLVVWHCCATCPNRDELNPGRQQ